LIIISLSDYINRRNEKVEIVDRIGDWAKCWRGYWWWSSFN